MLDFRIETFLCVCKYMNYTKAARILNITQPAVSQHIKYLEDYYHVKLFSYSEKTLSLTPAGQELKSAMLSMKHDTLFLKDRISKAQNERQNLKFGATLTIGQFVIVNKIQPYMEKYPDCQVEFTVDNTEVLLSMLDAGTIDFAVIEGFFPKSEYAYQFISREKFAAVCGVNYPLDRVAEFSELFSHRLLVREKGSGSREILVRYIQEYGYDLHDFTRKMVVNNIYVLKRLAAADMGITFLYRAAVEEELERGELKELMIPDFDVFHEFNFVWRKGSIFEEKYQEICRELMQTEA